MKKSLPPHDPIESMGEAYELLLEKAQQKAHQSGVAIHQTIDEVRGDIVALTKFSEDEVVKLEAYVKRDLNDAAGYLDKTGKELKEWVGFDVGLMKRERAIRLPAMGSRMKCEGRAGSGRTLSGSYNW